MQTALLPLIEGGVAWSEESLLRSSLPLSLSCEALLRPPYPLASPSTPSKMVWGGSITILDGDGLSTPTPSKMV